jgi:hypothetical protein
LKGTSIDCAKDVPLEFGDIIEIPEREYRLGEKRIGLAQDQRDGIAGCLELKVTFVVKGEPTEVKLSPSRLGCFLSSVMQWSEVQNILRSSSDLSRLKIRRSASAGTAAGELTLDLEAFRRSQKPAFDDLWLRQGDVIGIPEKGSNADPLAGAAEPKPNPALR